MVLLTGTVAAAVSGASWNGVLSDGSGKPVADAVVQLQAPSGGGHYTAATASNGKFAFAEIAGGNYELSVKSADKKWKASAPFDLQFKAH